MNETGLPGEIRSQVPVLFESIYKRSIEEELQQALIKEKKRSNNLNNKLNELDSRISDRPSEQVSCSSPVLPRLRLMPHLVIVDTISESCNDIFASEAEE